MKCSKCKFYTRSKVYGNSCSCRGVKPCDVQRNNTKRKYHSKIKKSKKEKLNPQNYKRNQNQRA